jgi:poly(3-hydroxybutyrate) depolymerase
MMKQASDMRKFAITLLLILLTALKVSAYKKQSIDINVNGKQRNMVVFTPTKLPAKSPLFIVTHGMNQDPEYQYGSDKMYEMIDTAKFVITYLRSDGSTWDTGGTKDQTFVIKTIDEMASRFNIDTDRVYWSGFSMGSMLIHHCIANMQNKIAAFAPTSGIQFSEKPWTNCKKPVNLLEVIAYGDDVFGYEQYGIHAYIENYAKHDKHTKYSKTVGYKAKSSNWQNGDLEKWTGGPNGGEVWLYSYNNGGHWPSDQNRFLIWNFCKRFTLNQPTTRFTQPAGDVTHLCMAPQGEAVFPDITVTATAKATNAKIAGLAFFDGKTFLDSLYASPYTTTVAAPKSGKHNLKVEVVDDKGKTGQATCLVNYATSSGTYSLHQNFKNEGIVPQDWYVSNGSTKRVGGGLPYTDGPRILRFTNSSKAFEYGLLVLNATSKEKSAWAKFGDKSGRSYLTLHAGQYALKYKLCNWNQPQFKPVTVAIEDTNGQELASQTYTPTVNIGGKTSNKFTGVNQQTLEFEVPETGDYVVVFYAGADKNSDFVLGTVSIQAVKFTTSGIEDVNDLRMKEGDSENQSSGCFDLSGRRLSEENLKPGLYIIDGRKVVVK